MPTSGRASASLPSVAIITTIRSVPNVPLHEQPLFAKLVPSLSRTITAGEKSRMRERMHLVLCAREDDTFYLENAKNVSRALRKPLGFMYPKIFYYPSLDVSLNEAMLYAYAIQEHQVQFLHRTFEDVQYARVVESFMHAAPAHDGQEFASAVGGGMARMHASQAGRND